MSRQDLVEGLFQETVSRTVVVPDIELGSDSPDALALEVATEVLEGVDDLPTELYETEQAFIGIGDDYAAYIPAEGDVQVVPLDGETEIISEVTLNKKHFAQFAAIIPALKEQDIPRKYLIAFAGKLSSVLKEFNPSFNLSTFMRACGIAPGAIKAEDETDTDSEETTEALAAYQKEVTEWVAANIPADVLGEDASELDDLLSMGAVHDAEMLVEELAGKANVQIDEYRRMIGAAKKRIRKMRRKPKNARAKMMLKQRRRGYRQNKVQMRRHAKIYYRRNKNKTGFREAIEVIGFDNIDEAIQFAEFADVLGVPCELVEADNASEVHQSLTIRMD